MTLFNTMRIYLHSLVSSGSLLPGQGTSKSVVTATGVTSAATAYILSRFGVIGVMAALLVLSMIADYITGIINAAKQGTIDSRTGLIGILRKLCYMIVVGLGLGLDVLLMHGAATIGIVVPVDTFFGLLVTIWLILNEWVSIIENLSGIGVPMPDFLIKTIKRVHSKVDEQGNKAAGDSKT